MDCFTMYSCLAVSFVSQSRPNWTVLICTLAQQCLSSRNLDPILTITAVGAGLQNKTATQSLVKIFTFCFRLIPGIVFNWICCAPRGCLMSTELYGKFLVTRARLRVPAWDPLEKLFAARARLRSTLVHSTDIYCAAKAFVCKTYFSLTIIDCSTKLR